MKLRMCCGARKIMSTASAGGMSESTRVELHDALHQTDWQALVERHPNMTANERKAFLGRVENAKIALQTREGLKKLWRRLNMM